ncbi:MAG: DNA adenine methylase [Planctomycetota bacterium]
MSRPKKIHEPLEADFNTVLSSIADGGKPKIELLSSAKPFVKWVGGKRSIVPQLLERMPAEYKTYREPFVGGGALFFAAKPEQAYISDVNMHLILAYQAVREDMEKLTSLLDGHLRRHNEKYFGRARERLSEESNPTKIAALFIYLNKTCFNGLYRVNKKGKFNVPIGRYDNPSLYDESVLKADRAALQDVEIWQHPFDQMPYEKGDFVYFDPPYHKTYSGYDSSGFQDAEHKKLADFCSQLHKAGVHFMLSNSNTEYVRALYKNFNIDEVAAKRSVSCKAESRGKETEIIVKNY